MLPGEKNRVTMNVQRENQQRTRHLVKAECFRRYGSFCQCCDEKRMEFLTIDHIDGGGTEHRRRLKIRSGYQMYVWLRDAKYPPGYRVLCMNCNFAIGLYGYCPHQKERDEKLD
jgi:hypothetical protein